MALVVSFVVPLVVQLVSYLGSYVVTPKKGMTMETIGMGSERAPSSLLDSEIPYPETLEAADPESQHVSAGEPLYPKGPKYQYSGM